MKRFVKIVICLFIFITFILLVGRDHFITGTMLIMGRWFLIGFGVLFIYVAYKKKCSKRFRLTILSSVILILIESLFNVAVKERLGNCKTEDKVTLISYNLYFKNKYKQSIVNKILEADPDILVVQELTPQWNAYLQNSIASKYTFSQKEVRRGTNGIGIYSKYPLSNPKLLKNKKNLPYAQIVDVKINSKTIQLINTHLASPAVAVENKDRFMSLLLDNYSKREHEMCMVDSICAVEKNYHSKIMIGDLNTTQYEPLYRKITDNWVDLYSISGTESRATFPNTVKSSPKRKSFDITRFGTVLSLDYIFIKGNIKGESFEVLQGGSSDHLAIIGAVSL